LFLGESASTHRNVLKYYSKEITNFFMIVSTTLLVISYGLYGFLGNYKNLIWTLPIALYVVLRYVYLIYSGSRIARHPDTFYKDYRLVGGVLLWFVLIFFIIYFSKL
jgi:hypothetical protein